MNNKVRIALLIIFGAVFVVSAYMLVNIILDYKKDTDYYESMQQAYEISKAESEAEAEAEALAELEGQHPEMEREFPGMIYLHAMMDFILIDKYEMDMPALRAMNPDIVGWIRMEDTTINYPLLLGATNDTYIRTGPDGKPHNAGSLFLDYRCKGDFSTTNTVVYGHNQKNHTMFHDLYKFLDEEFAKSHPYFTVMYADGSEGRYEVFCSMQNSAYCYAYNRDFSDDNWYQQHLDNLLRDSVVDYGVNVTTNDKIITLSTCTNEEDDDRIIVVARKLE